MDASRGPVRAGRIVDAAGAFASTVGRTLGVDVPVHDAPLQTVVTEPAAPTIGHLVTHAARHLTLKQAGNGAFIIGGGWTAGLVGHLWVAQRVVPRLDRLHVVRSWAAMNIGIDGAPILGEDPRVPGLFHAVTSNGYTLAPLVGRITVDRGATDRDVGAFSVARFSDAAGRAPSSPIRSSPAMPEVAVRERLITGEAVFHEGGPPPAVPLRRGAVVTVVASPFAARYVDGAAVLPPDAAVEALRPQDGRRPAATGVERATVPRRSR